jgi:Ni,Fe-hydrogenase I small subunit
MPEETIGQHLKRQGVSRRDFVKMCGVLVGAMGLRYAPPLDDSGLPAHL